MRWSVFSSYDSCNHILSFSRARNRCEILFFSTLSISAYLLKSGWITWQVGSLRNARLAFVLEYWIPAYWESLESGHTIRAKTVTKICRSSCWHNLALYLVSWCCLETNWEEETSHLCDLGRWLAHDQDLRNMQTYTLLEQTYLGRQLVDYWVLQGQLLLGTICCTRVSLKHGIQIQAN